MGTIKLKKVSTETEQPASAGAIVSSIENVVAEEKREWDESRRIKRIFRESERNFAPL